jgi:glycosyltransferase involved in cell wall biosynthesis
MPEIKSINKLSESTVFVAYCGDFNRQIGPPTSMLNLCLLLSEEYSVCATKQLVAADSLDEATSNNSNVSYSLLQKAIKKLRQSFVGSLLSQVRLLSLLLKFNLIVNYVLIRNSKCKIIITQPFFIPMVPFLEYQVFYIRRANRNISESITTEFLKRFFEVGFIKFAKYKTIFLVPIKSEKEGYEVIPNHFYPAKHKLNFSDSIDFKFHIVGTWNWRKGADRYLSLFNSGKSNENLYVYGGLGNDTELNKALLKVNIKYEGIIHVPFKQFSIGDVFLSFSRLEGFQRSMVEALLQGCLIIAVKRPDSEFIANFPGVYIINWNDISSEKSICEAKKIINKIKYLSKDERTFLGMKNRELAISLFSSDTILSQWKKLIGE